MRLEYFKNHWPVFIIIGTVLIFLFKTLFLGEIFVTPGMGLSDYTLGIFPQVNYISKALHSGRFPLWDEQIYGGYPFLANAEPALFYPLTIPLYWLFSAKTGLDLYTLFTFLLAGIGTYCFAQSLKLSKEASLISAFSFTFSAGVVVKIVHLDALTIIAHLPLLLFLTNKFLAKKSLWLWLLIIFIVTIEILNFEPQTAFIVFFAFVLYFLFKAYLQNHKQILANCLILASVFIFSLTLSAVQLVPSLTYFQYSDRQTGIDEKSVTKFPFVFAELAYFLRPAPFGDPSLGNYNSPAVPVPSIFWENNAYTGLIALIFGTAAVFFLLTKKKEVLFFSFLFIITVLFALDQSTPVGKILELPPFAYFRLPSRFLHLSRFSLAILAGFGFELAASRFPKKRFLFGLVAGGIVLADLFSFGLKYNPTYNYKKWLSPPKSAQIIFKDQSFFRIFTIGDYEAFYSIYEKFNGWKESIQPYYTLRELLPTDFNQNFNLYHADGYIGFFLKRDEIWKQTVRSEIRINSKTNTAKITPFGLKLLRLKNVKYITSSIILENEEVSLKQKIQYDKNEPTYYLYELTNPLPHAFFVSKAMVITDEKQVLAEIGKEDFKPEEEVIIESSGSEKLPASQRGEEVSKEVGSDEETRNPSTTLKTSQQYNNIAITSYQPEKVIIKAEVDQTGFLILTDSWFPGWNVTVNQNPTPIYRADYLYRAIKLEPGKHTIEFTYFPVGLKTGAMISIGTIGLLVILSIGYVLWQRRKSLASSG